MNTEELINLQIQSSVQCFEPNTVKRMIIPYYWFAHKFIRIEGITFEGHDQNLIECYDSNNELIRRVVSIGTNNF